MWIDYKICKQKYKIEVHGWDVNKKLKKWIGGGICKQKAENVNKELVE